jgi:putative membrane protein
MSIQLLSAVPPIADGFDMHGDFGTGWWIAMLVGMILVWGLIIAAVVWVVRELAQGRRAQAPQEGAIALLDRRFAAGEISAQEYRDRRAVLVGEPPDR